MSKTAIGKKQERNRVKSKPKDGGLKSMLTVGGKMSREDPKCRMVDSKRSDTLGTRRTSRCN